MKNSSKLTIITPSQVITKYVRGKITIDKVSNLLGVNRNKIAYQKINDTISMLTTIANTEYNYNDENKLNNNLTNHLLAVGIDYDITLYGTAIIFLNECFDDNNEIINIEFEHL